MATPSSGEVWAIDSEWGFRDFRLDHESAWEPVVLCLVGLRFGRRAHFRGRDPRLLDFFREHARDLFVSHSVVAEMKFLLRLGVALPARWFDTFLAWRYLTNRPSPPEAGLSHALHRLGMPGMAPAEKKELQRKILELRFDPESAEDCRQIVDYCYADCAGAGALYGQLSERVQPELMAHWVEYLKAVARMELLGIPFDVAGFSEISRARSTILAGLTADVNRVWPVISEGGSIRPRSFLAWCRRVGIAWPAEAGPDMGRARFSFDDETLKDMEARHPFIAKVRQVRKTIVHLGSRSLVVDPVAGRHYYSTHTFRSVTGRNQPRQFIFSGPKWMRHLIVPESPEHVLVYVDFVAQEVGIAAALSDDPAMKAMYQSSDCHMEFAKRAGAVLATADRETLRAIRRRYKTVNLGVLYGQTATGISARLGIAGRGAGRLLAEHHALFPQFWRWSERVVQVAYDLGWIATPCGWRSSVPPLSNERTWMNWPMQAAGGDILRLMMTYLDRQGVRVLAPVHDGVLLSCRRVELGDLRDAVDYAAATAVEHVLPGFPLRWEVTVHENGRFEEDRDGLPLWTRLNELLAETNHAIATP